MAITKLIAELEKSFRAGQYTIKYSILDAISAHIAVGFDSNRLTHDELDTLINRLKDLIDQ